MAVVAEESALEFTKEHFSQLARMSRSRAASKRTPEKVDDEDPKPPQEHIFQSLRCFTNVSSAVLGMLARVAQRCNFPADAKDPRDVLIAENSHGSELVWVLEQGSVRVEERGELLGTLEAGTAGIIGLPAVLGVVDRQLLTVRRVLDTSLTAWCVPSAAVSSALRRSFDARQALEDIMERQMRKLFVGRVARTIFFSHCSKRFFHPLHGVARLEFRKRNSVLFKEQDSADTMVILVRGTCQLMPARAFAVPQIPRRGLARRSARGDAAIVRALPPLALLSLSGPGMDSEAEDDGESHSGAGGSRGDLDEEGTSDTDAESRSGNSSDDCFKSSSSACPGKSFSFTLPESKTCHWPVDDRVTTTAGPDAVLFGDAALLGFSDHRPCTAVTTSDCVVFVISKHLFSNSLKMHPQETQRFQHMAQAKYQEWQHCGLKHLPEIDMFCNSSAAFLSALAAVAQPRLYFPRGTIIADRSPPEGLILLMAGTAVQATEGGEPQHLSAPHSFGPLQFLGANLPCQPLQAVELCQVLFLSRQDLLQCLTNHPEESTAIVAQVLRHNGKRVSLVGRVPLLRDHVRERETVLQLNLWHIPFCSGLTQSFVQALMQRLEFVKIVPGQPLFRNGDDAEILAVLLKGKARVRSPLGPDQTLGVPLLICGRSGHTEVETTAVELCDLHRLPVGACDALAKSFPQDLRELLSRAMTFQTQVHFKMGYPWWGPAVVLRAQDVFLGSQEDFLTRVAEKMTLEIYLPGDQLVGEGDAVDSTMIIECGEAEVRKIDVGGSNPIVVAVAKDGFWVGGIDRICGFGAGLKRSATITATKVCKVHRLMNAVFVSLMSDFPEERQRFRQRAERQLQTRAESESLEEYSFFKGLHHDLLNLLRPKCRPLVFFADEAILRQGEPADSMVILDTHSDVIIEVDGEQCREHVGRACLGVVALLSKWPVKRASTVVTRTACSVRMLSRHDWLEALKHHPEHRRWIDSFTAEQLEKVSKARGEFQRRRAWDKIQFRENCASQSHRDRMTSNVSFGQGGWSRARSSTPQMSSRRGCRHRRKGSCRRGTERLHASGAFWECGSQGKSAT
uniref:Cyclic nucleotide-binding domain-containing protein n=1 Tax=Alexandrium monilatum TaxID=311494 RepID=A0A7S4RWS3_9DINO